MTSQRNLITASMAIAMDDEEKQQQQQPKRTRASHSSETLEDPLSVPTLPPEIILQILYLLPVESLLRCKSVCKLWYSIISDPHFVRSHLTLSTNNIRYAHHRLIYCTEPRDNLMSGLLSDVLYDGFNTAIELDHPLKSPLLFDRILGSCDGLVLLKEKDTLLIWNPSTRKSNRLPLPYSSFKARSSGYVLYGLGYDASTYDYKVVAISSNFRKGSSNYDSKVKIYSLKTGNWKNIGDFPHGIPSPVSGKFCNGSLHWVASSGTGPSSSWTIVSLELANETFGAILQPVYDEGDEFRKLGVLGEWLCVICDYFGIRADVWVMKEYGVKDSWTKLVSIPYIIDPEGFRYSVPLCVTNDGKVLLQFGPKLVVYDSKNQSFSEIQDFDESSTAFTFVESLVSPS